MSLAYNKKNISLGETPNLFFKRKINGAVVLGLSCTGLGVVRSLGRKGVDCIGISREKLEIGGFSKYCKRVTCPDKGLLGKLIEISNKSEKKPVLYPTDDEYVLFVSENRKVLEKYFIFLLPEKDILNALLSKAGFYKLARKVSGDVPETIELTSFSCLHTIEKKVSYPCIVKPSFIHEFQKYYPNVKAFVVNNREELFDTVSLMNAKNIEVVIQEIVRGKDRDQFSVAAYIDRDGKVLCCYTSRKIRQQPASFGVGTYVLDEKNDQLQAEALRFLEKINFKGIAEVEFRKNESDNKYKIIEVNARAWAQNSLAEACGVNIIYNSYLDLIGRETEAAEIFRGRTAWVFLVRDVVTFAFYCFRGEISFREWLDSYRGKKQFAVYSPDDLFPVFMFPVYLVSKLHGKIKKW